MDHQNMSFFNFKKFFKPRSASPVFAFSVKCNKCGSIVKVNVNLSTDLQQSFDGPAPYVLQKEVQDAKCFTIMKLYAEYDADRNLVKKSIEKGSFLEGL